MRKAITVGHLLVSAATAAAIGSSLLIIPANSTESRAAERPAIQLAQGCGSYGPFATIRRANEIAGQAQLMGLSTQVFHNGDGYYVRVC